MSILLAVHSLSVKGTLKPPSLLTAEGYSYSFPASVAVPVVEVLSSCLAHICKV